MGNENTAITAEALVIRRTGMSAADAAFYVALADARIRSYLHLDDTADLSGYVMQIADIAVLYWQKDQSTLQSSASLGYSRQSFSEGGVSRTTATMNGSAIWSTYDDAINNVLETLDGTDGMVVFL